MSESATVMIPEPMPMFGPVQLAAVRSRHHGSTNLSGAVIVLQRRKCGSSTWYAGASKTTNSSGVVRFTVMPSRTGTYYYRLVHKKGTAYAYARSGSTRLHISS